MFQQPKHCIKMVVLVLLLLMEATAEEKKNGLWAATHTRDIYNITNLVRIYSKVTDMSQANLFLLLTGKVLKSKPTWLQTEDLKFETKQQQQKKTSFIMQILIKPPTNEAFRWSFLLKNISVFRPSCIFILNPL